MRFACCCVQGPAVLESVVGFGGDGSRDKSYVPGAPIVPQTPVKPCESAHEADALSRSIVGNAQANQNSRDGLEGAASSSAAAREGRDRRAPQGGGGVRRSEGEEHFSAEELESSGDESSMGSTDSSKLAGGGDSRGAMALEELVPKEDSQKRKLFGDDASRKGRHSRKHGPKRLKIASAANGGADAALKEAAGGGSNSNQGEAPSRVERSPPKIPVRTITNFFAPRNNSSSSSTSSLRTSESTAHHDSAHTSLHRSLSASHADAGLPISLVERGREVARREEELEALSRSLERRAAEMAAKEERMEHEGIEKSLAAARQEVQQQQMLRQAREKRAKDVMLKLVVSAAKHERALSSTKIGQDKVRVGSVAYERQGMTVRELWEEGSAFAEWRRRQDELVAEKEELDKDRKAFNKRSKTQGMSALAQAGVMQPPPVPSDDIAEQEEIYRLRDKKLKEKEKAIAEEKEKLEREKYSLIRELKRLQDQQRSSYKDFPVLHDRYVLLQLLGKGGFSEVYKAFDLVEMQEVACKIHELNSQWSEEKKSNYMKHATREYEIQKKLSHQRIVRLIDVFEVSKDGFCTVLEYCDSGDLEHVLKNQKTVPEREARSIIMQVFAGLRYLNDQKQKIIHYDLKPANILFHNGEVKISDFGLSKIMEDDKDTELTSQGAGTYWYLPPECFEIGHSPPKISSKVDVWSAGIIFFQMLYGFKPFGHGMSQEKMLIEQTITKSTQSVPFPEGKESPKVSDRAKDFCRKCLAYHQWERPDVLSVFQDPYRKAAPSFIATADLSLAPRASCSSPLVSCAHPETPPHASHAPWRTLASSSTHASALSFAVRQSGRQASSTHSSH